MFDDRFAGDAVFAQRWSRLVHYENRGGGDYIDDRRLWSGVVSTRLLGKLFRRRAEENDSLYQAGLTVGSSGTCGARLGSKPVMGSILRALARTRVATTQAPPPRNGSVLTRFPLTGTVWKHAPATWIS